MIELIYPKNGAKISILTDFQKEFYRREYEGSHKNDNAYDDYVQEAFEREDITNPVTVVFKWKRSNMFAPMRFKISTSPDLAELVGVDACCTYGEIFPSDEDGVYCVCVTNFKSGTKYYWTVDDLSGECPVYTFTTDENETRFINIPGARGNIRDIGGKMTASGKRIKQGYVFRGAAMEKPYYDPEGLTTDGKRIVREIFKMKLQIDLRYEAIGKMTDTVFGKDGKYVLYPSGAYNWIHDIGAKDMIVMMLELFADEDNYPIFFHCVAGADRTGTLAMLLEGLLGVSDEDIIADYNATTLNNEFRRWDGNDEIKAMVKGLNELYPNKTLSQQIALYVENCGISNEKIEKIKNLLLE